MNPARILLSVVLSAACLLPASSVLAQAPSTCTKDRQALAALESELAEDQNFLTNNCKNSLSSECQQEGPGFRQSITLLNGEITAARQLVALNCGPVVPTKQSQVFVRQSIATLTAAQIASLQKGIQVMMSRSVTDPTSYRFQANIHGTYDAATTALETSAWNQCEHGSYYFFSWHRMYLYFFERILRAASGDTNFALPYWNWSDPAQYGLPKPFWQPANASNSLYIAPPGRQQAVDNGTAVLSAGVVDYSTAFTYTNFDSPAGSGLSFGGQIALPMQFQNPHGELESQPHDVVHGTLGGLMGDPDTAAQDPIFWLHHANIDRLWKRWLDQGGSRTDPETDSNWMNATFTFFDEHGTAVKMTGAQIIDTVTQLDYRYDDDPTPRPPLPLPHPIRPLAVQAKVVRQTLATSATTTAPTQLTQAALDVSVPISADSSTKLKSLVVPNAEQRIVLEIDGIQYDTPPGIYYEVYLDLPAGSKPDFRGPNFVGNLSFFALMPHHMNHANQTAAASQGGIRDFDVTKVVSGLVAKNAWNESKATVTFVPRGLVDTNGEQLPISTGKKAAFGKVTIAAE